MCTEPVRWAYHLLIFLFESTGSCISFPQFLRHSIMILAHLSSMKPPWLLVVYFGHTPLVSPLHFTGPPCSRSWTSRQQAR
ncbi:hypothetical protein DEU56DRAFT_801816 [Suillus clintonianus]|uniref:uncharacterized protein n=1 Tax=Suillus clintonianus TaxID=1904413 RepID=UPI001B86A14A|nr:uncharacterized protein DEU56DRAFT_801816 [Suillus clintonianus]KAG2138471.1 hypothetical protein DEU56DRAFT_801816 [Suillus clintonianus]